MRMANHWILQIKFFIRILLITEIFYGNINANLVNSYALTAEHLVVLGQFVFGPSFLLRIFMFLNGMDIRG